MHQDKQWLTSTGSELMQASSHNQVKQVFKKRKEKKTAVFVCSSTQLKSKQYKFVSEVHNFNKPFEKVFIERIKRATVVNKIQFDTRLRRESGR